MNRVAFTHIESRRTFWARHLLHRMVASLKRRGRNLTTYRLCAFPNDLIGREIAVTGTYEGAGIAAIEWLCEHGVIENTQQAAFLDVGANVGIYTVALAARFGSVLAFEPHPVTSRVLALNVSINDLRNVVVLDYALSDSDATAELCEGDSDNLGASSLERGTDATKRYTVTLRHAASAVRETTAAPVALIKMDVEGHEPKVVAGLWRLIAEQQPILAFEANDHVHNQRLVEQLSQLGYERFLALDYCPAIRHLWLRVLVLTLAGVRHELKPVSNLDDARYSLVFALPSRAAARWDCLIA